MKTLILIGTVLFSLQTTAAFAQDEMCNGGLYFKTQDLCATIGWDSEEAKANLDLSFVMTGALYAAPMATPKLKAMKLYFWDRAQGSAQQPFFINPDASAIMVQYKMNFSQQTPLLRNAVQDQTNGYPVDGIFTVSDLSFFSSGANYQITVSLEDENSKVTDSATMPFQAP